VFDGLTLQQWRQFSEVSIRFHRRLTVLTGANGAGKTTILNILNKHFGWNVNFVSSRLRRKKIVEYFADYWEQVVDDAVPEAGRHEIGTLTYRNGTVAALTVPTEVGQVFDVDIANRSPVDGLFISSHRPVYLYQRVDSIPTQLDARAQLLDKYIEEMRARYNINTRVTSPNYRIKEALISLATFGYGNQAVTGNPEAIQTYEGFQRILGRVLPATLGFTRLRVDVPDVMLETRTGDFSFDAVSGGVSSIIDLAWQIHMFSLTHPEFVVLIDEPENHLHPELQRDLLPSFLCAFPGVQFVVATHNPFIVGSVPDSNVYVLKYNDERRVVSQLLEGINKAGTSDEILRDALGLDHTTANWVGHRIDAIVEAYSDQELNAETIASLRAEMRVLGLDHLFPSAVDRLSNPDDQAR
jgi:predicted ATPase